MLVKTTEGMKDVKIQKPNSKDYNVTPENYIVPEGEENRFHVILEIMKFNAESGERVSKARIQKFGAKAFKSGGIAENLKKQGYTITILHDPKEFAEENERKASEKRSENAQKSAEIKAKADQEKISAGVADALKAMGLTPEVLASLNQPKTTEVKTETLKTASKDGDKK